MKSESILVNGHLVKATHTVLKLDDIPYTEQVISKVKTLNINSQGDLKSDLQLVNGFKYLILGCGGKLERVNVRGLKSTLKGLRQQFPDLKFVKK